MNLWNKIGAAMALAATACIAHADADYRSEYAKKVSQGQQVTALGDDLAGDKINMVTGALEFDQTDVSLPGNFNLPVSFGRRYFVDVAPGGIGALGGWKLDVPYLSGSFTQTYGWEGADKTLHRCSVPGGQRIDVLPPGSYYHGTTMHLPGGGDQVLLVAPSTNSNRPSAGGPYYWNTNKNWWFSCLSATKNNGGGEAFVGHAPDGSTYTFDWIVSYSTQTLTKDLADGRTAKQTRKNVFLLATKVVDRFGNSVDYTYIGDALMSISASDGRTITLTYANGLVDTVSDGTRTWHYVYTNGALTQVTLPDNSKWQYSLSGIVPQITWDDSCDPVGNPPYFCYEYPIQSTNDPGTGYIIHPSGARVDFTVDLHFYTGLSAAAIYSLGLQQKTISVPGSQAGTWVATGTWKYAQTNASTDPNCATPVCLDRVWTEVLNPDGTILRQLYDQDNELLQTLRGSKTANSSSPVIAHSLRGNDVDIADEVSPLTNTVPVFYQESDSTYTASPTWMGTNPARSPMVSLSVENLTPEIQHDEYLQAARFKRLVTADEPAFRLPTRVVSTGSGLTGPSGTATTYSKTVVTEYQSPDLARWIVGQVKKTCLAASSCTEAGAKELTRVDFNTNSLPSNTYAAGVLQQTLSYDMSTAGAKGTLSSITDGRGNQTILSNWKRGTPQSITFPGSPSTTQSAQVNNLGDLDWVKDELGSKTCYGYDANGRLNKITYPSEAAADTCNTTTWAATTLKFAPAATTPYGLPSGHWEQTVQTGSGKTTTYFDAQWRPVLALTEISGISGSQSFTVNRYDSMGRKTFSSYPVGSLASINDSLTGTTTSYDALGRPKQVSQSSELGALTTTTEYLTGFTTRVTNPRGVQSTTNYQAFDAPKTDVPVGIVNALGKPEQQKTVIVRDSLDKPLTITRASVTRTYAYDTNQRLCKTIDPEAGATLVDYDAAGNIAWVASGTGLTSNSCDRGSVTDAMKTSVRQYDALNRLTGATTVSGVENVWTTYTPDGKVDTLVAANGALGANPVTTSYVYDRRRLLTEEHSSQPTGSQPAYIYDVYYGYDANAHLATVKYPDPQLVVAYAPDALGRVTSVKAGTQVFANNVTYFPNGAIKGFTYGNGVVHTMTQNSRLLPSVSLDKSAAVTVLNDTYAFDKNGNVDYITDGTPAGADNRSRDLGYDNLDRLIMADAQYQWGTATYTYDALDNIRTAQQGSRQFTYTYDSATNRLSSITGTSSYAFGYDAYGNVTSKGAQDFTFDQSNRMTSAELLSGAGVQTYRYDGTGRRVQTTDPGGQRNLWVYSQAGQVLYNHDERRGQDLSYIYLGNTQVATRSYDYSHGGTVAIRYQHTDSLGSIVAETDGTGAVVKRNSYAPYGEAYGATSIDGTGYTGHVTDRDTGLTYMQQRYYDAQIGGFLSTDPADSGFNSYYYASDNPYSFNEPDEAISTPVYIRSPHFFPAAAR